MPANVSIEYAMAEKKYRKAKTIEERLAALLEMQRTVPSHKGAENLRAEISRKIKRTRDRLEKKEEQRKKVSARSIAVKKEGIGQIALVGLPNAGKSTLLKALTNAEVEIAPYPFTTKKPRIGMMDYMKARIQLVEVPPLIKGSCEGKAMGRELFAIIRNADAIALVLDSANIKTEFLTLKKEFKKAEIAFNSEKHALSIEKSRFHGISIVNAEFFNGNLKELKSFLRKKGFSNASVVFRRQCSLKEVKEFLESKTISKKALAIVVEKNSFKPEESVLEMIEREMETFFVSDLNERKLSLLKEKLFLLLERVLVFTKKHGGKPAEKPMALPLGSTVADAARALHEDFEKNFRYAKIWGSAKYPGQRVSKDFVLKTGDLVEIYC